MWRTNVVQTLRILNTVGITSPLVGSLSINNLQAHITVDGTILRVHNNLKISEICI